MSGGGGVGLCRHCGERDYQDHACDSHGGCKREADRLRALLVECARVHAGQVRGVEGLRVWRERMRREVGNLVTLPDDAPLT